MNGETGICVRSSLVLAVLLGTLSIPLAGEPAEDVVVSLSGSGFHVAGLASGRGSPTITLELDREPPEELRSEPPRLDDWRYGRLVLAGRPEHPFLFRLDLVGGRPDRLYLDADGDFELGDDPGPYRNRGSGLFATTIAIPFASFRPEAAFLGDYRFWVFASREAWAKETLRAYSTSQLEGSIELGDSELKAFVVERLPYDGSFLDDGICIDLDFDGSAKSPGECVEIGEVVEVEHGHVVERGGRFESVAAHHSYRIRITW